MTKLQKDKMSTRIVSQDPNKPITIRLEFDHKDKLKLKIKCLRKGIRLTDLVKDFLADWISDIPDQDVAP